jgi:hypothetical protein
MAPAAFSGVPWRDVASTLVRHSDDLSAAINLHLCKRNLRIC